MPNTNLLLALLSLGLAACGTTEVKIGEDTGSTGGNETGTDTDTEDTGTLVDGAIAVSPAELDLGVLFVGQATSGTLEVTNVGEGAVDVLLSVVGGRAASYTLDAYTASPAPGETSPHILSLTPTSWGDHSASVLVEDSVSGGRVEVRVLALVQEDNDGDGFGSVETGGQDCNDADAAINPDAAESWYDGVDQDCAGDDDYDQDADGVTVDVDCDDTSDATYPGAEDAWYDGIDSDCAGNDDYDQDGDTYVPDGYIGLPTVGVDGSGALPGGDCDDEDPARNPAATETWYDGIDQDCAGDDDQDADGDGFPVSSDCDDLNSAINPAATETWYDGVDQDCAADDDYDQDKDGVTVDADCVDTDATAYPGAADDWYDGVDSDCDGSDDYDQDGDGYVPDAYAGLPTAGIDGSGSLPSGDCDDVDAAFSPGVAETWYDGVDSNCDGADDYDQDADGYTVDADCDDTDAAIYPGAPDAWYDDVDSDCAGDNDFDQDGDGTEYPADCDDTDPAVGGASTEVLDGADNDCDGRVDDLPITDAASGYVLGTVSSMYLGDHGQIAMSPDLTGDGAADLVLGARNTSNGYAFVVTGASAAAAAGAVTNYDTAVITGESGYPIGYVNGPFADTDGDGDDDLLVGGIYSLSTSTAAYGRSYLFDGGSGLTGSLAVTGYTARFSGDSETDGSYQSASGDIDGDGLGDVVVGSAFDNYSSGSWSSEYDAGSVSFFPGDCTGSYDLDDADERIYGENDYDYLGFSVVVADVTGDGYDDILAGAPGYDGSASSGGGVFVFAGDSGVSWNTRMEDAAWSQIDGTASSLGIGEDTLAHPGDVDGDGTPDIGITSEDSGDVWVFLSTTGFDGSITLRDADWNFSGTAGDLGSMLVMDSDLDGDGTDDLAIGADGDDSAASNAGAVYVFTSGGWSSTVSTSSADVTFWGTASSGYFGSGGAGGQDLDGDGRDDLAIGEVTSDRGTSDAGAVWIVSGW